MNFLTVKILIVEAGNLLMKLRFFVFSRKSNKFLLHTSPHCHRIHSTTRHLLFEYALCLLSVFLLYLYIPGDFFSAIILLAFAFKRFKGIATLACLDLLLWQQTSSASNN